MKSILYAALAVTIAITGVTCAEAHNAQAERSPEQDRRQPDGQPKPSRDRNAPASQPALASAAPANNRAGRSHPFATGSRFSRASAPNYRRVDHRESRRLSAPAKGCVWVRAGNDALLVRLSNNVVTRVVSNVF